MFVTMALSNRSMLSAERQKVMGLPFHPLVLELQIYSLGLSPVSFHPVLALSRESHQGHAEVPSNISYSALPSGYLSGLQLLFL